MVGESAPMASASVFSLAMVSALPGNVISLPARKNPSEAIGVTVTGSQGLMMLKILEQSTSGVLRTVLGEAKV